MADNTDVITTEVTATESDVAAVRTEMTAQATQGAQPGAPIDRIPYNPQLAMLEASGVFSKRIASTDRCIRVIELPLRGGSVGKFHCSRPCVGVGDQRLCPDHDKSFFQPNQTAHGTKGRVLNSDSIPLSSAETDEMRRTSKSFANPPAPSVPPIAASQPVAPTALPVGNGLGKAEPGVSISFSLEELAGRDILSVFQNRVCEALDSLPCANVRQMKQVVAIQEKVAKIASKPHSRRREVNERTTEGD